MAAFTDDFTGTNDDLLEDRTGWTLTTDGGYRMTVFGNEITPRAGGGGSGYSLWTCTDQGSANHYTQVRDKTFYTSADGYWCCRLVDIDNFIGWYCPGSGGTGSRLMKMVATSITDLVSFQGADEDLIKVTCDGNSIEIYQDGGQVGTTQTVTDHNTETSQGTVQGVALGEVQMWDDFEAGPMAGRDAASDYLENKMLGHVFNVSPLSQPANIYVALCTSTIEDDDTGSTLPGEVTGGAYARKQCNTWDTSGSQGFAKNDLTLMFPKATADWGEITNFAICDAQSAGNVLFYGELVTPRHVHTGDVFVIDTSDMYVETD